MLTKAKMLKELKAGNIKISPFDESKLGTNSYDLMMTDEVVEVKPPNGGIYLSTVEKPDLRRIKPCSDRFGRFIKLQPFKLYLGATVETFGSDKYIPHITNRSSIARCGVFTNLVAGFGDVGFDDDWTLEIFSIRHCKLYIDYPVCQGYFIRPDGPVEHLYEGKYKGQKGPTASLMMEEVKRRLKT